MSRPDRETNSSPDAALVQEALAALIANTRRVRRKLDLLEIASRLEIACQGLGSLRSVGDAIGLSEEMLRQFQTVSKLSPRLRILVKKRVIDSVDIAHRLSKLSVSDQETVAGFVQRGELDSEDVRALITLRKAMPDADMTVVVERLRETRNIREYIVEFPIAPGVSNLGGIRRRFVDLVGARNIRFMKKQGGKGVLALNRQGRDLLEETAKKRRITKRALVEEIIS